MQKHQHPRPIALLILDGWGYREAVEYNAIAKANIPNFHRLWNTYPHALIQTSGLAVGLPRGQMGNSEVGHLNLGAGRVVYQDITRITKSIEDGDFFKNPVLCQAVDDAVKNDKAVHVLGLLSPGGIHSLDTHIDAMMRLAASRGAKKLYMHAFLDGRDTPPKSAATFIQHLENVFTEIGTGKIATLQGRFYGMDRDQRWERVKEGYDLLTLGTAAHTAKTALSGLEKAYAANETDEFVKPTSIHDEQDKPIVIEDGDSVIFMNYRSDRAREITHAFNDVEFTGFERTRVPKLAHYVALTQYDETLAVSIAFPPQSLANTLGEYLAKNHKTQLRIAETEKYAHVTFFFDGGLENNLEGEDKILIPSPKVEKYDETPEMSARLLTEKLVEAIHSEKYDVIICNYANCDMIGHTGNFEATVKTVECLDDCLGQVIDALQTIGGEALITADHGNAELMFDESTGQTYTAHTTNPVPFIYVGRPAQVAQNAALCDIAPTILSLINLPIPPEMTGHSVVELT